MTLQIDLSRLKNKQQLLSFLGVDENDFNEVLSFNPLRDDQINLDDFSVTRLYPFLRHEIPKKNPKRGVRIVWEPTILMTTYKALSRRLTNFFTHRLEGFPHPRSFGYVYRRNILQNAQDHCGHRNLLSVDLEEFFQSICTNKIERLFVSIGIAQEVSKLMSEFVTIGGKLALGLPTSPIIANAICLPMDKELQSLAERNGVTYSRYADDISFSGNSDLPDIEEIESIVLRYEFNLSHSKTRRSTIGQAHFVTGLSVSDPFRPHVPKQKKHRLRQELYYANKFGLENHFRKIGIKNPEIVQREINRLDGLVKYIAYHEPKLATDLKALWLEILKADGSRPSFAPKNQRGFPFSIFIDEAEFDRPGYGKVLAICMAVSQHPDQILEVGRGVLEAYLADPWAAGDREAAIKRGMHFVDAHPDLRLKYVDQLCSMPFEGYVAFAGLSTPEEYEATYLLLINKMIRRRLMAAESKSARFVFERNEKVSEVAVRDIVMRAYKLLKRSNNRRPINCTFEFKGKPDLCLSVPDFLLGALKKYLELKQSTGSNNIPREMLLFEQLRDKYRLILDVDNWIEYSRRKPIRPWGNKDY